MTVRGEEVWKRSNPSRSSRAVGRCWSLAHLVQRGPDEPSLTWTQLWVQSRMPDYSLNWTVRSSAIQGWQRCLWCNSPTRRWPSRSQGPLGFKSAMEHWPSGTDARQSAEKPLHQAVARRASSLRGNVPTLLGGNLYICLYLPPDRSWHKVNDPKVDYSRDLGEVKIRPEPRLETCWTMLVIGPPIVVCAWWG